MRPAVFLDRDGTVIEHVHHLTNPADVRLITGVTEAIRRLQSGGYPCVVVTNQSVIGRGLLTEHGLAAVHEEIFRQLANDAVRLDGVYFCPIVPSQGDPTVIEHPDRKPGPGMLLRAAHDLELDIQQSWMVGDTLTDVLAGWNARCRGTILVQTGCGGEVDGELPAGTLVAANLSVAADYILQSNKR